MSYLRFICISTTLLLAVSSANATNLEQDFQRCASVALNSRAQSAALISVDNQGLKLGQLNHDISGKRLEYHMDVVEKSSGKDLGSVTCTFTLRGDLISSVFDRLMVR